MTTHDRFRTNIATWGWLWLKHRIVATPLETLAWNLRWILGEFGRRRHPELARSRPAGRTRSGSLDR